MEPILLVNGIFPAYYAGADGFDPEAIQENLAYVIDGKGWKLFKRNGVSTSLISVSEVSGLRELETSIQFTATKIPLDLIRRVTAFFRAVYIAQKSEAVGYLFYSPTSGEWDFVPPAQTAGPASAKYGSPSRREEGWVVAGTIHSHASMSAFHSGTDHHDEEGFDGVHITIGRLDSVPEFSCSLVVQGVRRMFEASDLIDGMAPADAVPAAWLEAVKEPAPRLPGPFQVRAEVLYGAYFSGEVARDEYLAGIRQLRHEAEKEETRVRLATRETTPAHGLSRGEWDRKLTDLISPGSPLGTPTPARASGKRRKKSGR